MVGSTRGSREGRAEGGEFKFVPRPDSRTSNATDSVAGSKGSKKQANLHTVSPSAPESQEKRPNSRSRRNSGGGKRPGATFQPKQNGAVVSPPNGTVMSPPPPPQANGVKPRSVSPNTGTQHVVYKPVVTSEAVHPKAVPKHPGLVGLQNLKPSEKVHVVTSPSIARDNLPTSPCKTPSPCLSKEFPTEPTIALPGSPPKTPTVSSPEVLTPPSNPSMPHPHRKPKPSKDEMQAKSAESYQPKGAVLGDISQGYTKPPTEQTIFMAPKSDTKQPDIHDKLHDKASEALDANVQMKPCQSDQAKKETPAASVHDSPSCPPDWTVHQWELHRSLKNQKFRKTTSQVGSRNDKKTITFTICCSCTDFGEELRVVGSDPALGCWNPDKAARLTTDRASFPVWTSKPVKLDSTDELLYKYVLVGPNGTGWEDKMDNRKLLMSEVDEIEGDNEKSCDIIVDDNEFNEAEPDPNCPRIRSVGSECKAMTIENLAGDWSLIHEKSDSLGPLLEATGVSWVIKTALEYTSKYDKSLRVCGDRLIVRTYVNGGDDTQITSLSGEMHKTKEIDGDTYSCVCGWDDVEGKLKDVRYNPKKGEIVTSREIISDPQHGPVQKTIIEYTPRGLTTPTLNLSLFFVQNRKLH